MTPPLLAWVLANVLALAVIPFWTNLRSDGEELRNRLVGLWLAANGVVALAVGIPSVLKGDLFWWMFSLFLILLISVGMRRFLRASVDPEP